MRRGLKPNVVRKLVKGRAYYYYKTTTWVDGRAREKYTRITAEPHTEAFDREYWAIRSGQRRAPSKTTYAALIAHYKESARFKKLAESTRKQYRGVLDELAAKNGHRDVTKTRRADIEAIHQKYAATPRKADRYVQILSILFGHAIRLEWRTDNPCEKVELFGAQREILPWPEWFQRAYVAACDDADALMLYHLGRGTGQRPGDLAKMRWQDFRDGKMRVVQEKTGEDLEVWCPAFLVAELQARPQQGEFIFAKGLRDHISYDSLEKKFRRVRARINADGARNYSLHGLRKLAVVELAEAGCSDAEIMAVTGHRTAAMAAFYRRKADRGRLSKRAQERRTEQGQNGN